MWEKPERAAWSGWGVLWLVAAWTAVVIAFGMMVWDLGTALRSDSWPRVLGNVTEVKLKQNSTRRSFSPPYSVWLEYRYSYLEHEYTGEEVSPFALWGGDGAALDVAARFPKGSDFYVAVNPGNPQQAYLQTGFRWAYLAPFAVLIPAVLACSIATSMYMRSDSRRPAGSEPRFPIFAATAAGVGVVLLVVFFTNPFHPKLNGSGVFPLGPNPGPGDFSWFAAAVPAATILVWFVASVLGGEWE